MRWGKASKITGEGMMHRKNGNRRDWSISVGMPEQSPWTRYSIRKKGSSENWEENG
jgi:hypothetical protein